MPQEIMQPIKLHDYQETAKTFLMQHPKAGLFLDVGFGKTLTTLSALMELARCGQLHGHILVIAPKAIARSTWIDEMDKWGINASFVSLIVNEKGKQLSRKKREQLYQEIPTHSPAFYFINRELVTDLVSWHLDKRGYHLTRPWPFQTVIIDELQSFKSHSSKRFLYLRKIMPYVERFIGLTGTPVPNGMMDLWSEIFLMDQGQRLGPTITAYRETFFDKGLVIDGNVVSWNIKPGAEDEIYRRIKDIVISVKNPSIKLPPVTYNNVTCYMDDDEVVLYKKMMKDSVLEMTDKYGNELEIVAKNAAVLTAKLSQMASGTLYTDTEHNYTIIHRKKLEQLEYIIENTGSPVLIAYHFKSDESEIAHYLSSKKIETKKFDGSPEMIHNWNAGMIPVMILQPAAAGHGINIQDGGHTLVWYTVPFSLEEYIQTNGRLNRQGQKYPVMIHHLLTAGTIDQHILNCVNKKDMSERALMDAVAWTAQNAGVSFARA